MVWLVWALLAVLGWGGSYVFLRPAGAIFPLVVQVLFGLGSSVLSIIAMGFWALASSRPDRSASEAFLEPWKTLIQNSSSLYLIGYISAASFAGLAYLMAASDPQVPLSVLTALTASYPIVTTALAFAIFREFQQVDLRLAVPGILLSATGCTLLALSPKPIPG